MMRLRMYLAPAYVFEIFSASQHTGGRPAKLHVSLPADGRKLEHRVEGRNLIKADERHIEHLSDIFHRRAGDPAANLLLSAPQHRNDRRGLLALRIFGDCLLGPQNVVGREGETLGLNGIETANAHRSTSPKTISREPRTALTSASMWPRHM